MSLAAKLVISMIAGLLVFAGMGYLLDWRATLHALSQLDPAYVPIFLCLGVVNYVFRFMRWHYYLHVLHLEVPLLTSTGIHASGFMMAVTPGKLGEVMKSYLLKRIYGIKMRVTAPVILAERLTDVISLLMLSVAGAAVVRYGERALLWTTLVTAAGLAVLSSERLVRLGIRICEKLPILNSLAPKLHEAHDSMSALIAPKPLLLATLATIPVWVLEGLAFYLVFAGMEAPGAVGRGPPLVGAIFIYCFSTLIGGLSMIPGGLGVAEAGLAGLSMTLFSVPSGQAAAATLVIRVLTLWFAVAAGLISFGVGCRIYGIGFHELEEAEAED